MRVVVLYCELIGMDDLQLLLIKMKLLAMIEESDIKKMVFEEAAEAITRLLDENQSLWFMFDEMKASDIALKDKAFEDDLSNIASLLVKPTGSKGEA